MITITDAQRDNMLHQTSELIDFSNSLHQTFAVSNNLSDKAIENWHKTLFQAQAVLENIEAQVRHIESINK